MLLADGVYNTSNIIIVTGLYYTSPSTVHTVIGWVQFNGIFYFLEYMKDFGPSGVCALPLTAGTNEGGHYFRYILVRAECVRCPWLLAQTKVATILGTFWSERVACASGAN